MPAPLSARVIDLARNRTVVFRAGAQTVPITSQTLALARLTSEGSPAWKSENATITAADMVFDRVTFTARTLVRLITLSVELFEDADPSSEDVIANATGSTPGRKWEDDHVATLDRSPFAGQYRVRYQRGDEAIRWHNGSRHGITAPGEKAGHSDVLDLADFCRAYLNWWPGEIPADWLVISEADWRALADPQSIAVDPVSFAADVTPDRSAAAIGVAGRRTDGLEHAEVIDHRPGTSWAAPRLVDLATKWNPCAVMVDDTGPAGSLVAPLEAAGVEVIKPTTKARAAADSGFYDAVTDSRSLRYVPRPALDAAVAGAATRPLGDSWAWARKGLSTDICPLVAVSLARWGHATRAHLHNRGPSIYI